jgi:DMSO/TMAO reductase YedYZ molybdopterin-dependent catalytic subunit
VRRVGDGANPGRVDSEGAPIGRRVVLGMLALGAIGIVTGKRLQSAMERVLAPIESHDPTGISSLIPDGGGFRFYSVTSSTPHRSAADYRLDVSGLIDKPTTLTLADLQAMPQTHLTKDFQCVTGWRVESVHWSGVSLGDLLDSVGVQSQAKAVLFHSFDGTYTESLTLDQARRPDVLVALTMLGKPVTQDHGGPVRLYVAPMYGYKSCKWLDAIRVSDTVVPGYWEHNGYDVDAWVGHSNGRDDATTSS